MIVEAIGLGAAIEWVEGIGFDAMMAHEARLTEHAVARLSAIPGLRLLGAAQDRGGVFRFTMKGAHAHDIATLLDRQGARASCGVYTTEGEIDFLADSLDRVREFFA